MLGCRVFLPLPSNCSVKVICAHYTTACIQLGALWMRDHSAYIHPRSWHVFSFSVCLRLWFATHRFSSVCCSGLSSLYVRCDSGNKRSHEHDSQEEISMVSLKISKYKAEVRMTESVSHVNDSLPHAFLEYCKCICFQASSSNFFYCMYPLRWISEQRARLSKLVPVRCSECLPTFLQWWIITNCSGAFFFPLRRETEFKKDSIQERIL